MPTKLKIKVTREILERTKYCTLENVGSNCAIAVAIRDIFPDATVGSQHIYIDVPFSIVTIQLPQYASNFIWDFDHTCSELRVFMDEIEFEVDVPDEVLDTIDISQVTTLLQNHPNLTLIH